jgi:uncharacterized protein YcfL
MKKIFLGLIIGALFLGGCTATEQSKKTMEEKIVTKAGTITTKIGSEYLLKTDDEIVNITSTKVNLDSFMKKEVEVTGMFSGSTLYVDEIR